MNVASTPASQKNLSRVFKLTKPVAWVSFDQVYATKKSLPHHLRGIGL